MKKKYIKPKISTKKMKINFFNYKNSSKGEGIFLAGYTCGGRYIGTCATPI